MMTYGYNIVDHNDPFIDIVDKATEQFAIASTPGAFLVDTLPFRKLLQDSTLDSLINAVEYSGIRPRLVPWY